MICRTTTRSEDGRESPETVGSKTTVRHLNGPQGEAAKKSKAGSRKWDESKLAKWEAALVKARLALRKKREKKKEQRLKSTSARLRRNADAAIQKPPKEETKKIPKRRGRPPLAGRVVEKAQALEVVATQRASKKISKMAKPNSGLSQADDGLNGEPMRAVSKVRRGRKRSTGASANLDEEESAERMAEMERREEIKKKWRSALVIARVALYKKRERKREKAQEAAFRRLRRSEGGGAVGHDSSVVHIGFSLKRPSVEELRNFAKRSRP